MRTIFDQLNLHAACSPTKPAIMLPDRLVTYDMVVTGIRSVQRVLTGLDVDRDRPVGLLVDLPSRHLIVFLALLKSGYSVCAIRKEQIGQAMACGVGVVLTDTRLPLTPGLRAHFVDEKWFQNPGPVEALAPPLAPGRIARVMFTSGSTGTPKAVGWSLEALHHRINDMFYGGIGTAPRFLTSLGLSGAGLTCTLRVLWSGNTVCFAPFADVLGAISTMGVTEIRSATSQISRLIEMQESFGHGIQIPLVTPTGAQNSPDLIESIRRVFGATVIDTYTSTESGHIGLASDELLRLRRQRGNCFAPVAQVEIVDEAGTPLPARREGRIRARTSAMGWPFAGNLEDAFADRGDGWFYPGDVGRIDEDGLLVIMGRADEVINDGGVKYNPELLEAALIRHPQIEDAAVVRVTTEAGQFEPWGAVVAKADVQIDHINQWLGAQLAGELASIGLARLFIVDAIPRTANGKVARDSLRKQLQAT